MAILKVSLALVVAVIAISYGIATASNKSIQNTSSKSSWRPIPDDSIDAGTSDQDQMCFPKSWNILLQRNMIIKPGKKCSPVAIVHCYCLTSESQFNNSDTPYANFGNCFYGCFDSDFSTVHYQVNIQLDEQFDNGTCSQFNRKGILCGQCIEGYGPPAYSFNLKCVPCGNINLWTRIPLYILVAYGPLTVFLGVIVVFTVSANSAPMHGWILICQLMSTALFMRIFTTITDFYFTAYSPYMQIIGSLYGIWNLDFFRSVYKPFCLHPSLTTIQVMSLDYIIAAYPLVIIVVTYILVDLYSRDYRPVVIMWRPFHYCFIRFRHQLNIRTSLIDAFGTFFSLSYVKFLSTTVDLVTATRVWSYDNKITHHVYYDGTMKLFRGSHIPYGVMGLLVGLLCNVLPLVLILLYSFRRSHTILNYLPMSIQTALFPFMDNILACYKDGTDGTRNCRYFGVVYHLALIVVMISFMWIKSILIIGVNVFVFITVGMLVAVIRPYKSKVYNTVDTILILSIGLCLAGGLSYYTAYIEDPVNMNGTLVMALPPFLVPLLYVVAYMGFKKRMFFQRLFHCKVKKFWITRRPNEMDNVSEHNVLVQ